MTSARPICCAVFEAFSHPILRVDLFRYLIVYLDGGLYADLDMEPYLPSDPLLTGASCVLSVEARIGARYQKMIGYRQPWQIANCIFAAAPEHPFFGELIEHIARGASEPAGDSGNVEDITGPRLLTRLIYRLPAARRGAVRILPQIHWMAPWEYPRIGPLRRLIYARHAAAGTWRSGAQRTRQTLLDRLIARNRLPNPFATAIPVLP